MQDHLDEITVAASAEVTVDLADAIDASIENTKLIAHDYRSMTSFQNEIQFDWASYCPTCDQRATLWQTRFQAMNRIRRRIHGIQPKHFQFGARPHRETQSG